jgi:hypothetical protein
VPGSAWATLAAVDPITLPDRHALARGLERGLLRALKGKAPSDDDVVTWSPSLTEAAAADADGPQLLDLVVHQRLLEGRVKRAVRAEQQPLLLTDGSTLEVAHAHKRLVEKEPRAPFVALRALLEARADDDPPERLGRRFLELREKVGATTTVSDAAAVRAQGHPLVPGLLEVLASEAGHMADDGHRLHRALDPAHPSFTLTGAREVLAPLREATAPLATRPARRTLGPAALRGALLTSDDGTRLVAGETWRALGYIDQVAAGATALLAALAPAPMRDVDDGAWRALGDAAGFALWRHPGLSRSERERTDRLLRATVGIRLLARAVLLGSWSTEGAEPEAWYEALRAYLGGSCPLLMREGWRLGLPGAPWPRGPRAQLAQDVARTQRAAWLHQRLRERFDEGWPCAAELHRTLRGAQRPAEVLEGLVGEPPDDDDDAARRLMDWLSEMM